MMLSTEKVKEKVKSAGLLGKSAPPGGGIRASFLKVCASVEYHSVVKFLMVLKLYCLRKLSS